MQWEKKICIRLTTRRILGTVLTASTVVNLVIVGAAFEAAASLSTPTLASVLTVPPSTSAFFSPPQTAETVIPFMWTETLGSIPTQLFTPTDTPISPPGWILCIKRFYWSDYRVQPGDTLYSLAIASGSTINELMLANCLPDDRINYGQILYVPRLPIKTFTSTPSPTVTNTPTTTASPSQTPMNTPITPSATPTPTSTNPPSITPTYSPTPTATYSVTPTTITPSPTSTNTPIAPTNPSIVFQNPALCVGSDNFTNLYLAFSVTLSNPRDVSSVTAYSGTSIEVPMSETNAGIYSGAKVGTGDYSPNDTVSYYFIAKDNLGRITRSSDYSTNLGACSIG